MLEAALEKALGMGSFQKVVYKLLLLIA